MNPYLKNLIELAWGVIVTICGSAMVTEGANQWGQTFAILQVIGGFGVMLYGFRLVESRWKGV